MQFIYYFPYVYIFDMVFFYQFLQSGLTFSHSTKYTTKNLKAIILIQHIESNTDFFKCLKWPIFFYKKKN